jgi:hypothetical protein
MTRLAALAAVLVALVLAGCSSSPALSWSCSVSSGYAPPGGPWDFTADVTASNPGSAPVTVGGYTVVIYDASGSEIFSGSWVLNGTVEPGQSLSGSYERGSVLDKAPASCRVPEWTAGT